MSEVTYEVGMMVKHKIASEWGLGEIVAVNGTTITVDFQNVGRKDLDSTVAPLEIVEYRKAATCDSLSDSEKARIEVGVNYFAKPDKIFSLKQLDKKPPPSDPSVYGWYFDKPPPYVPTNDCTPIKTGWWPFRTKWWLLYIGQAKKLKDRIVNYHIKGRHYAKGTMSSFRLSLGCLLSDELGLVLYYPPESFGKKDKKLNKWLEKHARVAWVETKNIDAVEEKAIAKYTLPLNYIGNTHHPLAQPLSLLGAAFRNIARSQKPKKKEFREKYKEFLKKCKEKGIKK